MPRPLPLALLLCFWTAGCTTTSWSATRAQPVELAAQNPSALRITLGDGTTAVVREPTVRSDSIFGRTEAGPLAVATAEVVRVEVPSRGLTDGQRRARALGVAAVAVLVVLAVRAVKEASW